MKKRLLHIILCFLLILVHSTCTDDWEMPEESKLTGKETFATFNFGFRDFEKFNVMTRATLEIGPESRVHNIFVFIFDSKGKRLFGKYFDKLNREVAGTDLRPKETNCWWVHNKVDKNDDQKTNGEICMRVPEVTNADMYLIANIDADMVNISPEQLNLIQTKNDIQHLTSKLNQHTISRNGYFPMVATATNVNIKDKRVTREEQDITAEFERLDSKIQFYFKVNPGKEEHNGDTTQKVKAFRPESWKVINIPKGSFVFPHDVDNNEVGYFNTDTRKFETVDKQATGGKETEAHGFSFYMLENREQKKKSVGGNYHLRDKRIKNSMGKYDTSHGLWEYAPEEGTYLEVKGRVLMDVDVSTEAKTQQLEADVKYYIHLGNINTNQGGSSDNYNVERNTFYTYTITINGVTNIEIEVTSSRGTAEEVKENEAGATGMVYIAKESIYTFDAHYGQRVFCFDAAYIDPRTVTWYVKTPFGKEGVPEKVGDTEIPSGMDYEWVHFLRNKHQNDMDSKPYSQNNQPYPGDDKKIFQEGKPWLMNVVEFTKYIKDQKRRFDDDQENDFRKEFDQAWYDKFGKPVMADKDDQTQVWWRDRIYFTVFVDEFYYDADPITGEVREDLWKEFVNQPNRLMHVLCDSERSLDDESTATGSVITLRQRSIQTPYNLENNALKTAWGCESVDETADSYLWFFEKNDNSFTQRPSFSESFGNTSKYNGAYNTACLWGLMDNTNATTFTNKQWTTYLNYEVENDHLDKQKKYNIIFLRDEYASMRYAAMMRNRDNNGNGKIDPEELRWYVASIDQLYGLYMGQQGINDESALYTQQRSNQSGVFEEGPYSGAARWRYHVISSTEHSSNLPIELWAEEGVSTSSYKAYSGEKPAPYGIRCVRNLGIAPEAQFNLNKEEENVSIPEKLIKVIKPSGSISESSVYRFDLSNINKKSLRFFTSHELEPENEFSEMSALYAGFETGPLYPVTNYQDENTGVRALLRKGASPCTDPKYRVPNVREGALMYLYCDVDSWWNGKNTCVSSYYSNGIFGTNRDQVKPYYSWQFGKGLASIGAEANQVRSVKDWNPSP